MNEENTITTSDVVKEIAKDVYADAGHEIIQPTGKVLGLLPRTIRAILSPLEKWVMHREYSIAETEKLLLKKLENVEPEKIVAPESYVAVPALQGISYCMDNDELRNMYANLLAKAMTDVERKGVHPSFADIIKQLCPDEAKILRQFMKNDCIPVIGLRCENDKHEGVDIIRMFSDIADKVNCEVPENIEQYLCNLIRLGLLASKGDDVSFINKAKYDSCKAHPYIQGLQKNLTGKMANLPIVKITEGIVYLTAFGHSFCNICIEE